MSELKRRDFLKMAGAGAAASMVPAVPRLFAQDMAGGAAAKPAAKGLPALVVIYLRGGMDALNAVIPHADKRYRVFRSQIAIPEADGDKGAGIIKLDDTFGLHPSLKSFKEHFDAKTFAPIVCVGSPHETRSHFDAQDFMEYGAPGSKSVRAGWLNRYLKATKDREEKGDGFRLRALAMQGLLPRALRGDIPVLAVPEARVLKNDDVLNTFEELYGKNEGMGGMDQRDEDPVVATGKDTLETLKKYKDALEKAKKERTKVKYPTGALGQKLGDIAGIMHSNIGLEVAAVDVGGWDHHAGEGGSVGTLATMLGSLADSMVAFNKDLGDHASRTVTVVMSEFGRMCQENGSGGTDHGHGGCMFLLGAGVKGGKVHGEWRGLDDAALFQGRDLAVTTDYRNVFATILRDHMKFETPKDFFPDHAVKPVDGLFA